MAIIIANKKVPEEGTAVYGVTFYNELGASVVPSAVVWTLSDDSGTVINSRSAVSVTPAAAVNITLSGDDLALQGATDNRKRVLYVKATYTSANVTGGVLPVEIWFEIEPLLNVT